MKKVICVLVVISVCLLFCGCGGSSVFSEGTRENLVSAIGFSKGEKGAAVYLETITVNSENPEAQSSVLVIKGEGETVELAFKNALKKSALGLRFSHCTAAVIERGVEGELLKECFELLYNTDQINLSVSVIAADSVEEFLNQTPDSTITVGFWVSEALSAEKEKTGKKYKNRLYEIEGVRRSNKNAYTVPLFGKIGEGILWVLNFENDRIIGGTEVIYE